MLTFNDDAQKKQLDALRHEEEEQLLQLLSKRYSLPYVDLSSVSIETDALRMIPEESAKEANAGAFKAQGKRLFIAVVSPENKKLTEILGDLERRGFSYTLMLASHSSLERAWSRYKDLSYAAETKAGVLDIATESLEELTKEIKNKDDVTRIVNELLKNQQGRKVTKMFEIVLAGALATGASDIHIEPEETQVRLRYRLDGVLHDVLFFDFETNKLLNSRIKLTSGMKLTVSKNAQDGRFSITLGDKEIEMRVSMIPGTYGESVVMRVLNPDNIAVKYEQLGISAFLQEILLRKISKPNGIILVTGPTGSGKTTTLYACLKKIHTEDVKIITIEDPVEYHLNGVTQTQVEEEKGYTFAAGLRSALRQDPDVIMVGEIRDSDTANTAINAALTGHLVFSTLHTNNAAGTIPRLIDLGVNPKVISSALSIALAQRLTRKLCENCKVKKVAEPKDQKLLREIVAQMAQEGKVDSLQNIDTQAVELFYPVGCEKCGNIGFKGRIGIHEGIVIDAPIETIISQFPSEREIAEAAIPQKIPTLKQDAAIKILQGLTTVEETSRVIDFYNF
jgi:type IV pilus assembly protein PilB